MQNILKRINVIKSPVLIIGCPRSGTTLLYNMLSEVSTLWSIGYESKAIIERFHSPSTKDWASGVLEAEDLTPVSQRYILRAFEKQAAPGNFWHRVNRFRATLRSVPLWGWIKHRGQSERAGSAASSALPQMGLNAVRHLIRIRNTLHTAKGPIRLLEKTPENCLRLPFLQALFPDARIIYLIRDGRSNINSLIEGWKQPHLFPGYQVPESLNIPDYTRDRWAFTLIPGWRTLTHSSLEEISAWQWIRCNEAVLSHRAKQQLPCLTLTHESLIAEPSTALIQIADFIDVDYKTNFARFAEDLPQINAISAPEQAKWRRQNPDAIRRILPLIAPMMEKLGYNKTSS